VAAEVLHELRMTQRVLHHMLAMTTTCPRGVLKLIGVSPEIKVMALLVSRPRVTLSLPKERFNA
jgi:hypothetical protein